MILRFGCQSSATNAGSQRLPKRSLAVASFLMIIFFLSLLPIMHHERALRSVRLSHFSHVSRRFSHLPTTAAAFLPPEEKGPSTKECAFRPCCFSFLLHRDQPNVDSYENPPKLLVDPATCCHVLYFFVWAHTAKDEAQHFSSLLREKSFVYTRALLCGPPLLLLSCRW